VKARLARRSPHRFPTSTSGPKPVAAGREVVLEYRFQNVAQRRFHTPIAHGGNSQRAFLGGARPLYPDASCRLATVALVLQFFAQTGQFDLRMDVEWSHGLAIDSGGAVVPPPRRRPADCSGHAAGRFHRPSRTRTAAYCKPAPELSGGLAPTTPGDTGWAESCQWKLDRQRVRVWKILNLRYATHGRSRCCVS
jgi:hypothetical protein